MHVHALFLEWEHIKQLKSLKSLREAEIRPFLTQVVSRALKFRREGEALEYVQDRQP